jgi:putative addiction module killer protein
MSLPTIKVIIFEDDLGFSPYSSWLKNLRDKRAAAQIVIRLDRLASGNLGSRSSVGEGVGELKIDIGPGYRVYFGRIGSMIVVLLCGGDKRTQGRDIENAKVFWRIFKEKFRG